MTTIFVTGAGGFVGSRLCERLRAAGHQVIGGVRSSARAPDAANSCVRIDDIAAYKDWRGALAGVDVVVHLAARAHCVQRSEASRIDEFRRVNVAASTELFRASREIGVRRFLFVSSIGVHGARTDVRPLREADPVNPSEPYAQSKLEAELKLRALAAEAETQLAVVRPGLVYGPGAKGNFLRLMRLVRVGWPLPFGSITARRNYLGLDNLCALLELCAFDPRAAGETFVAADPWSVDLPTVLRTLGESMGRRVRLWSVQPSVLRAAGNVLGLSAEVARLTSSLEIDSSKACRLLQWQPAVAFREEMDRMVGAYVAGRGRLT